MRTTRSYWLFELCRFEGPPGPPAPPADPPALPAPPTPPSPPADPPAPKTAEQLLADAQSDAEKWKALSRQHEDRAKANADKAKAFDDAQAANQTELEKAQARAAAAEQLAQQRGDVAVRAQVRSMAEDFVDRDAAVALIATDGGLARFVGDDGSIKDADIKTALDSLLTSKPALKRVDAPPPPPPQDPSLGPRGGGGTTDYRSADQKEFNSELAKHGLRPRST
jgi:hypothetical protein